MLQLSSLVLYPPKHNEITYTLFCSNHDIGTMITYEYFYPRMPPNIILRPILMPLPFLFNRSMGREQAALQTSADWVWFADVDYIFPPNCWEDLSSLVTNVWADLVWPNYYNIMHQKGDELIADIIGPAVIDIDRSEVTKVPISMAIGGIQIGRGDDLRKHGYDKLRGGRIPIPVWKHGTGGDGKYRKRVEKRAPIPLNNLIRISHSYQTNKSINNVRPPALI